ncbi:MAG TPA: zinc metallopeptidase [Kofleriaceae bacterium]|nr:zinc metallopeptidase [Kofleriaceae bacterium]
MGDVITRWWPVFATIAILPVANTAAVVFGEAIKAWLDRRIPDDLPLGAGAWIEGEAARLGYRDLRVIVTERSTNFFAPKRRIIHLDRDTYWKRDPLYWATAAHELGHARFAYEHPLASPLVDAIGVMRTILATFGLGLAFGNVMVAQPLIGNVAWSCLVVAFALRLLVLGEEAYASIYAFALVRRSGAVTRRRMFAVAVTLVLAWSTYLSITLSYAVMLARWSVLERAIGGGWTPSGGVTPIGYGIAGIATAVFVGAVIVRLRGQGRLGLERAIANLVIVWLMWDCGHPWPATLAVVPFGAALLPIMMLPSLVVVSPLRWLMRNLTGAHQTDELARDRAGGSHAIRHGNRVFDELLTRDRRRLSPSARLTELRFMFVLPLVIAFWLTG